MMMPGMPMEIFPECDQLRRERDDAFARQRQHGAFARHQQADDPVAAGFERVLIPVEQRLEKIVSTLRRCL
jgi:hypothetical protein